MTEGPEDQPVTTPAPEETPLSENIGEDVVETFAEAETPRAPIPSGRPVQTVGRRKEAVVRVRLAPGNGGFKLNGKPLEHYFPNKVHQQIVKEPFTLLELDGSYDVLVRVHGGGPSGQAGAVRLGVARSLNGVDPELNRPALKKAGFLSRDARVPERKKAGLKKARKAPQYSKR